MSNPETHDAVEIDETRLDDVSGGPIFMQYDGVKGSLAPTPPPSTASGVNVLLGDGSVRFVG